MNWLYGIHDPARPHIPCGYWLLPIIMLVALLAPLLAQLPASTEPYFLMTNTAQAAPASVQAKPAFILNRGQAPTNVLAHTHGTVAPIVFFRDGVSIGDISQEVPLQVRFRGSQTDTFLTGHEPLPGTVNVLRDATAADWHTNLPTYASLRYQKLYPGIDMQYELTPDGLKNTFYVAPGANPAAIGWHYSGTRNLSLDTQSGDLLLTLFNGTTLREHAPVAWQEQAGERIPVGVRFVLLPDQQVRFAIDYYDATLPLVIDPTLAYSSYLGGNGFDQISSIELDDAGNIYVAGTTTSTNFPTDNARTPMAIGDDDGFVCKYDATGQTMIYCTYFGGTDEDAINNLTVDASQRVYLTGTTRSSSSFPLANAFQSVHGGDRDAFLTQLSANGQDILYSTFLGGDQLDVGEDVLLRSDGTVYVTGTTASDNFPILNAYTQRGAVQDVFITRIRPDGNDPVFSTYIGGSGVDQSYSLDLDASGNVLVTGLTESPDFPVFRELPGHESLNGSQDAFIIKLNSAGTQRVFVSYFGGSGIENGEGIVVDSNGIAVITGYTESDDLPTMNAFQDSYSGERDAFVTRIDTSKRQILSSTYYGGSAEDWAFELAVDTEDVIYITGHTASNDLALANPIQSISAGATDAFVAVLNPVGNALPFATRFGGNGEDGGSSIALNTAGDIYFGGGTSSTNLNTVNPEQTSNGGGAQDIFIARIDNVLSPSTLTAVTPDSAVANAGDVPIIIRGTNLYEPLTAQIGAVALQDVVALDADTVRATVPVDSLAEGTYDLTVTTIGQTIAISDAFTVTPAVAEVPYRAMIYMGCDNDLSGECVRLHNQLEAAVAAHGNVEILILWDGDAVGDSAYYIVQPDTNLFELADYTEGENMFSQGEVDTSDPATLVSFAGWAQGQVPGTYKLLSLVGHGGGWAPALAPGQPRGRNSKSSLADLGGMLWDDHPTSGGSVPANTMATRQLADALNWVTQAYTLDVLYLDACLMGTVEVAAELQPYAATLVAHENQTFAIHLYRDYFDGITADTPPRDFSRQIAQVFFDTLPAEGHPAQVGVVATEPVPNLLQALDDLAVALEANLAPAREAIREAAVQAARVDETSDWRITTEDNAIDLRDFARLLAADTRLSADIRDAAQAVVVAMDAVMIENLTPSEPIQPWQGAEAWNLSRLNGLSIYFPLTDSWKRAFYNSAGLPTFASRTHWDEFINAWHADSTPPPPPSTECPYPCEVGPQHISITTNLTATANVGDMLFVPVDISGVRRADDVRTIRLTLTSSDTARLRPAPDQAVRAGPLLPDLATIESTLIDNGVQISITLPASTTTTLYHSSRLQQNELPTLEGTGTLVEVPFITTDAGCTEIALSDSLLTDRADRPLKHILPSGRACITSGQQLFLPFIQR